MTTKRYELRAVTKPRLSEAYRGIRRVQGWMTLALLMPIVLLAEEGRAQSAVDGFDPGADRNVKALAVQPDGKIIVGGTFSTLGGGGTGTTTRKHIGRLNPDGTLDLSFDPGANDIVDALAIQADGKIVVGGFFTTLGGGGSGTSVRNHIARVNPDGTLDTSFDPGANAEITCLAIQADGKILVGGSFTTLGGGGTGAFVRNRIARLNPDGTLDMTFNPGANDRISAIALQPDGKILVGGNFTTCGGGGIGTVPRSCIARLNPDGTIDAGFDPGANNDVKGLAVQPDGKILVVGDFLKIGGGGTGVISRHLIARLNIDGSVDSFDPGANDPAVSCVALQADGKVLVGGPFTTLGGGGSGMYTRNFIGRLYADGTLDNNFDPGANSSVRAVALQSDGKILLGGDFTTLGGGGIGTTARSRLGRLDPDGTLETSFNPGANSTVQALAVQTDGKIVAGGSFTTLGNGGTTARNRLGRLNPNGTVDTGFAPGANRPVRALAMQANGKILVAGDFTTLGGGGTGTTMRNKIGRLNADGTLDTSFNPGANQSVRALAVQANGKILVAGDFTTLRSGSVTMVRNHLGRLNSDGTLDTSFDPGANGLVEELAVQADGRILVAGDFTTLGGGGTGTTVRNRIGRLNADGTLDSSFDPGANLAVLALAIETDGKILVGGNFTTLGGGGTGTMPRNSVGRLTNADAALEALTVATDGTTITWYRSGTSPEVDRVTFELSTDGINYAALATPTRIAGGWQLPGQDLPTRQNIFVRARGFYSTGESAGSDSIAESVRNAFISLS